MPTPKKFYIKLRYFVISVPMEKKSNLYLILPPIYIHSTISAIFFSELVSQSSVETYLLVWTLSLYLIFFSSFLKVALFLEISDLGFKHISCLSNYTDTTDTFFNPFKNVMEVHTVTIFRLLKRLEDIFRHLWNIASSLVTSNKVTQLLSLRQCQEILLQESQSTFTFIRVLVL